MPPYYMYKWYMESIHFAYSNFNIHPMHSIRSLRWCLARKTISALQQYVRCMGWNIENRKWFQSEHLSTLVYVELAHTNLTVIVGERATQGTRYLICVQHYSPIIFENDFGWISVETMWKVYIFIAILFWMNFRNVQYFDYHIFEMHSILILKV